MIFKRQSVITSIQPPRDVGMDWVVFEIEDA
jgi:hypothetical protein